MRILSTPSLRLVPVTMQNAGELWAILQQPDLRRYQDLPNLNSAAFREMVGRRPRRLHPNAIGRFEWLIYAAEAGKQAMGWVSLRISERDPNSGEIGYSLLSEHRGRGVATEAVRGLLPSAFRDAALSQVVAYCLPENAASRRLLVRLGFVDDGVLPHGATVGGRPVDVMVHRMGREAWNQSGKTMVIPASA